MRDAGGDGIRCRSCCRLKTMQRAGKYPQARAPSLDGQAYATVLAGKPLICHGFEIFR